MSLKSIGRLASSRWNLNGLKKITDAALKDKKVLIEPGKKRISISRPCEPLGLYHSSYYYRYMDIFYQKELVKVYDVALYDI
ncbi:MAG: hypothetical protein IBX60_07995 [Candidatus Aminicenantes bacterium]|nr:hypothetical protein [Candidatus Aminicenantes bacterium]